MAFQCINIRQVPWKVLKTAAFGLGFQHLQQDLANVNAWKTMFDPYILTQSAMLSTAYGKTFFFTEYIKHLWLWKKKHFALNHDKSANLLL